MPSETAERLMDAVLLAVREHGYAGTSMQDLLRATGVSSSSMYHFFPGGKEALVAEAVRHSGFASEAAIVAVMDRLDPLEAVARIFDAAAAEMEGHGFTLGCPIGVPATEAPTDSEAIRTAVADVFDAWAEAYAAALRRHGYDDDRAAELGRMIVATYQGSVTLARATRSTQPYRDARALLSSQLTERTE
ncbi:MAG: TetR/AcrR family transcriptional regulator [Actinomycetota bacterium]